MNSTRLRSRVARSNFLSSKALSSVVPRKAIVLISGGLDSAVAAAVAKSEGFDILALTIDYGQRHRREIKAAKDVAKALGAVEHRVIEVPLAEFGGSAITDLKMNVPTSRSKGEIGRDIPATYVPGRNIVFLSIALSWAEASDSEAVFIGAHSVDYSGYPDCRPEFLEEFRSLSVLGTRRGVQGRAIRIEAPLILMDKKQIIQRGKELGVPFQLTWSCYIGGERACGKCDACLIRSRAFEEAGLEDPIEYERR